MKKQVYLTMWLNDVIELTKSIPQRAHQRCTTNHRTATDKLQSRTKRLRPLYPTSISIPSPPNRTNHRAEHRFRQVQDKFLDGERPEKLEAKGLRCDIIDPCFFSRVTFCRVRCFDIHTMIPRYPPTGVGLRAVSDPMRRRQIDS